MRLAYNEATCKQRSSLEQDLDLCVKHGVQEIELRFDMLDRYLESHSREQLAALLRAKDVRPITLNAIFNINFCDEAQWNSIQAQFRRACEFGSLLGANCVIILPSVMEGGQLPPWESILDDTVRNLKALAKLGGETGMRIAFEPIGDPSRCVRSIRESWEVVRRIDDPSIGLALDAYNLYLHRGLADVEDILQIDPERIFIVHVDDANENVPLNRLGTFDRVLPGDGAIDLNSFVRAIDETGYAGAYSVEILNQEYWRLPPEALFAEAIEKTKKALSCIERK